MAAGRKSIKNGYGFFSSSPGLFANISKRAGRKEKFCHLPNAKVGFYPPESRNGRSKKVIKKVSYQKGEYLL